MTDCKCAFCDAPGTKETLRPIDREWPRMFRCRSAAGCSLRMEKQGLWGWERLRGMTVDGGLRKRWQGGERVG